jgi:hypothetical protein
MFHAERLWKVQGEDICFGCQGSEDTWGRLGHAGWDKVAWEQLPWPPWHDSLLKAQSRKFVVNWVNHFIRPYEVIFDSNCMFLPHTHENVEVYTCYSTAVYASI